MALDSQPLYRIEEAARRVGIPAASLRAWERRYGITRPARTRKGYRLYSEVDLHWLGRMRALVDKGIAAAEAARQVRAEQVMHRTPRRADADKLREGLLDAACSFDDASLERVLATVGKAFDADAGVREVVQPALAELGMRWADGRLGVAHEHWLTQRLRAFLVSLVASMRTRTTQGTVLLACFADEEHDIACYVLAVHLAARGFRPVVLGARTPASALAVAVREVEPDLVCLSLTNTATPADRRSIADYVEACGERTLWIGGQGAASLGPLPAGVRLAGASAEGAFDVAPSTSAANRSR